MKNKIVMATGHAHAYHRVSAMAAINNGYFRAEGLPEIELKATGEDHLTIESLKSGEIDFGLDVKPGLVIEEYMKGAKIYIIAGMLNYNDLTLIATPDINTIADLKGKKIGVIEQGGGREVMWLRMLLRKEGLDPDKDVTWITEAGHGSLNIQTPRLQRGDYHAVALSGMCKRPEVFEEARQAGFNVVAERSETHPEGFPDRLLATMGETLEKYPQMVKGVIKGIVRGYRFARQDKNADKIREMYLTCDWGKEGFGWGEFDKTLLEGMVRVAKVLPHDGRISQSGFDSIIAELKAWGKVPPTFTKDQVLRLDLLQQVLSELNAQYGPEGYA